MIDIKYIIDHTEEVKENCKYRLANVDIDLLISKYKDKIELQKELESLQAIKNQKSKTKPTPETIEEIKDINKKIEEINPKLISLEMEVKELLFKVPNLTHKDVIRSINENDNPVLEIVGEPTKFDFKPKDHVELAEQLDLIDLERGAKVAGNKFYYLKNELALMELALMQYALDTVVKHGFTSFITPDLAKKDILESLGFNPRGESAQIYNIENSDLSLIGTAEITMGGYHANEIIDEDKLPLRYVAFSHCFRTEAGAYSKFSKGIFRVHQFSKVEMFAYTVPEDGEKMHNEFLNIEKEIFKGLKLPFRVIDHCTADLGSPSIRTFDLEAWMPGKPKNETEMGNWAEVTSTSNCTDYQARGLNIKVKRNSGEKEYLYTLNGTAISSARALICIMENYQTKDGTIIIPEVLRKYMGDREIIKR